METEPLARIDEHASGETPEDVAILYSWANLQGAKYRDFSANRREYRAQMRHRAAEQLRLMELRAQSEAEAAAAEAEAESAAAHAEADAATVKLAASRAISSTAPEQILKEKEVEELRRSSLREAAQQARRAAAERLEAARRAEAAALADSIARREEREIAEAQASALRQAAQYHDSEVRSKQMMAQHTDPEGQVPGRISDPYSPQILAEGAYYDGPGAPPSELEASRFRTQREYIERSTGADLPPFKMPPLFNEERLRQQALSELTEGAGESPRQPSRRQREDMGLDQEDLLAQRKPRQPRKESESPFASPRFFEQHETLSDVLARDREAARQPADRETADTHRNATPLQDMDASWQRRPEVVNRIADPYNDANRYENHRSPVEREAGFRENTFNGSLLNHAGDALKKPRIPFRIGVEDEARQRETSPEADWQRRRGGVPPAIREALRTDTMRATDQRSLASERPQLYSATPRPSGSWLRQISAREAEVSHRREPLPPPASSEEKKNLYSPRPSVEATYDDGHPSDSLLQSDQRPSGFRPPWLSQAQAPRQSGSRRLAEDSVEEKPRWLNPEPIPAQAAMPESVAKPQANPIAPPATEASAVTENTLQSAQEKVASRWFALNGVFDRTAASKPSEGYAPREQGSTPIIAVYSLAGGVGKTSLVATLGRALSSLGEKVLLTDTTSHGLLPFYFGANQLAAGVMRTFSPPEGSTDAPIYMVSYDLEQNPLDGQKAALVNDLLNNSRQVNRVLLDLSGNCGWLVDRLARLKPTILVPVTADMNSVVSLQAVEKKFSAMQSADGEPLRPMYLLNQFDASLPLHLDLREVLRQQLGDRLLPIVIRRAPGISEALAEGMTVVDYDPDSPATQDFQGLANWVRAVCAPAAAGLRNLRWSER